MLLITQPDHAAVAGAVMRHWRDERLESPRRETILLAVSEHDNGWIEVDRAPLVNADGRLLDFISAPDEVRQGVWPRGIARLESTPYAAALVAAHALHIYRRYRPDPGWAAFFAEIEAARNRLLQQSGETLEALLADYVFVRAGDLVSLTFCNAWTDVQEDETGYAIHFDPERARLHVTPDPFRGDSIPIEVTARRLTGEPFESAAAARAAFDAGPRITLKGVVTGGRP